MIEGPEIGLSINN